MKRKMLIEKMTAIPAFVVLALDLYNLPGFLVQKLHIFVYIFCMAVAVLLPVLPYLRASKKGRVSVGAVCAILVSLFTLLLWGAMGGGYYMFHAGTFPE